MKNKTSYIVFFFCFLASNMMFSQEKMNSFKNDQFEIFYPENMDIDTSGSFGVEFLLKFPLSSNTDDFRENVNLLVQDLSGSGYDLDQYIKLSETQIPQYFGTGSIIESNRIEEEGSMYHHLIYKGEQSPHKLQFEQYCWIIGEKAFVLTFTAEQDQYDDYKEEGKMILNSFRFL